MVLKIDCEKVKHKKVTYDVIFMTSQKFPFLRYYGCFKTRTRVIRLLHQLDSCFARPMFMG